MKYKKAIVVDEGLLDRLERVILEYYDRLYYFALLKNGDTVRFDSKEELIQYDNFSERSIKYLRINFGIGNSIEFSVKYYFDLFASTTVTACFELCGIDESHSFRRKVLTELDKSAQSRGYTFFARMSPIRWSLVLLIVLIIILMAYIIKSPGLSIHFSGITTAFCLQVVLTSIIAYLVPYVLSLLTRHLFPPIVFMIGEEKKRIMRFVQFRNNIFWCVIIAFCISMIVAYISKCI